MGETEGNAGALPQKRSGWLLAVRTILWIAALGFCVLALGLYFESLGSDPMGRGIGQALALIVGLIGVAAVVALLLAARFRAVLYVAGAIVLLPVVVVACFFVSREIESAHYARMAEDRETGKADFGKQPALLAVAQAIAKNDPDAIRAAAKNVPDLNAPGEEGKTLLFFAVDRAVERPDNVPAVRALLSLGADPNYNNGQLNSYAMWRAMSGPVDLLRAMLDAGGDPNGRDFRGNPLVFWTWELTYNEEDRVARLHLLLDRGTDVNSVYPETSQILPGYTLLLARVHSGHSDANGYSDAIILLERGADPHATADDGTTLAQLIDKHRKNYAEWQMEPPPQFRALCDWLSARGLLPQ